LAWLTSAGLAAVVSLLIERAALVMTHHEISAALDFDQYPLSPMAPATFAISLSVAIICDVDLRLGRGWVQLTAEELLCGAAMSLTIFICTHLLDLRVTTASQTPVWFPYVFSFSLGFLAGLVASHLYRRERSQGQRTATAPAMVVVQPA